MPPKQEEEFELVLGNKQLLSLFFLAVVLFAVFFSFGYMVGFGRGQQERAATIAAVEPIEEAEDSVRLPDTLLEEAPTPPPPGADVKPAEATAKPASLSTKPAEPPAKSPPSAEKPKAPSQPVRTSSTAVSAATVARSTHLQVAALRVREDAQMLADKLKDKGYRAVMYDQAGDGWFRVLVGPFADEQAAKKDQQKLKADGLESLLRRP